MGAILLDTTVLIDVLRNQPQSVLRLRNLSSMQDTPYTSAINVEEIIRGLRGEREADAAHRLIGGLGVVPITEIEAQRGGTWRREFARNGITLAQADCLVAAAAASVGGRLATANITDFPMSGIAVEHWPSD